MSTLPEPRHRLLLAARHADSGQPAEDPLVEALAALLAGGTSPDPDVTYAYDIYVEPTHRAALDAFILAGVTPDATMRAIRVPAQVVEIYQHLFLDPGAFRNDLEVRSYAVAYDGDAYGKELVRTAVQVGAEYLLWTYSPQLPEIDTRRIVRHTMVDGYFRGMAHKGNPLTSPIAKEALKWTGMAIKNAELLEKMDPRTSQQAVAELRIAIEGVDATITFEQSPVPVAEILKH